MSYDEPTLAQLASDVRQAKAKLLATMKAKQTWPCSHCGQARSHGAGGEWDPRDLREASGVDGPVSMIALEELSREGAISFDARWKIHVAKENEAV